MVQQPFLIPIGFKNPWPGQNATQVVLAGDIGGTKANVALFQVTAEGLEEIHAQRFVSKEHETFEGILAAFLEGQPSPQKVCLSVAGPVLGGKVKFTNLDWEIDINSISRQLGGCPVALLNDLEATAYGLAALKPNELHTLQSGNASTLGNIAILAAGTGLGEAGLYFDGRSYYPFASEGGHSDFAPRTQQDINVLQWLQTRHERVSWERLVSGIGIQTIWEFLTQVEGKPMHPLLANAGEDADKPAIISKAALDGSCQVCTESMVLFNRYLAIEGANLVLKLKATGGLYLAGGIAPKVLPLLDPLVWKAVFEGSGRMRALLEQVPVQVVINQQAPLLGSAYFAVCNL